MGQPSSVPMSVPADGSTIDHLSPSVVSSPSPSTRESIEKAVCSFVKDDARVTRTSRM